MTLEEKEAAAREYMAGKTETFTGAEVEEQRQQYEMLQNLEGQQPVETTPTDEPPATDQQPSVDTPAADEPIPVEIKPEINHADLLAELSKGKVKSVEEFMAILEKADTPQEELDAVAKSLNEARKRGLDTKQWAAQQLVDVDSFSQVELAKTFLIQTKGWTEKKAQDYLEAKFFINDKYEEGDDVPREYKAAQFELEDLAATAKGYFNANKIDLDSFHSENPQVKEMKEQIDKFNEYQSNQQALHKQTAEAIDSSLKGLKEYTIGYNYKDINAKEAEGTLALSLTEEMVSASAEMLKDPVKLLKALSPKGDFKEAAAKLTLLTNEKLFSDVLSDNYARSVESFVQKNIKNASSVSIATAPHDINLTSEENKRAKEFMGGMPRQR